MKEREREKQLVMILEVFKVFTDHFVITLSAQLKPLPFQQRKIKWKWQLGNI